MKRFFFIMLALFTLVLTQCEAQDTTMSKFRDKDQYNSGALRTEKYLPLILGKKVGIVANQTSIIGEKHLVDSLLSLGVEIKKIYTPEHGFRGTADAGARIANGIDEITKLPIVSLYGKNKKPTAEQLQDIDIILFDLQDVGTRFYTYISTLTYVMEAAAENNIAVIILDRPNPNGFYIDGPVLEPAHQSFIGLHPVPIVYGMTIGEYGKMVNGEHWMKNNVSCELTVIPCENYDRNCIYELPVKPSPNLPNWESIYLYPSLCLFEGSIVSIGRGTESPFQIYGHPNMKGDFSFTPKSKSGASKPKLENSLCHGMNLTDYAHNFSDHANQIHLEWFIDACNQLGKESFFSSSFALLAGTTNLETQIKSGLNADQIRSSWQQDLENFKIIRAKYLIYADFENDTF